MVDQRVQGTVLVIGGAAKHDPRRALADHPLAHCLHQAGFANTRLAAQEHYLAHTVIALRPAFQEQRHFCIAADKRREARGTHHVQTTLGRTIPQDPIYLHRCTQSFESMCSQILIEKISPDEPEGRGTDDDRSGTASP